MNQPGTRAPHLGIVYLVVTWACVRAFWYWQGFGGRHGDLVVPEAMFKLIVWSTVSLGIVALLNPAVRSSSVSALGLGGGAMQGIIFGVLVALPMMVTVAWLPRKTFDADLIIGSSLVGPVAEEVLFRGLLFRQLVRHVGWPVWAAILVSATLFGLAHVGQVDTDLWRVLQGPDPANASWAYRSGTQEIIRYVSGDDVWLSEAAYLGRRLQPVAAYAFGGAIFAWVAYRFNSLWPTVALHVLMNFCWDLSRGEHGRPSAAIEPLAIAQFVTLLTALSLAEARGRRRAAPASVGLSG